MSKQPNFLIVDAESNTVLVPSSDPAIRDIVRKYGSGAIGHDDKRELWQYISQYLRGVEASDENSKPNS